MSAAGGASATEACPRPIAAAIDGVALGGGLELDLGRAGRGARQLGIADEVADAGVRTDREAAALRLHSYARRAGQEVLRRD